jgi:hypothetical protein
MDYDSAVKDLKDIKSTMTRTAARFSRHSGWFFMIQGIVWLVGFLFTQYAPAASPPVWVGLNAAAVTAMIILGFVLYGRGARQRQPGLAPRIVAGVLCVVAFDALIILLLGIGDPVQITMLVMLSAGFCNFLVGLFTRPVLAVMGALLMSSVAIGGLLWPSYLYFCIAVFGGGPFVGFGLSILLRKGKPDA